MSCGAMIRTNIAVLSLVHEVGDCVADHSRIARCASRRRAFRWPRCWRRRHGRTARRARRTDAWRTRRRAARFPWAAYRRDRAWRRLPRLARSLLLAALLLLRTGLLLRAGLLLPAAGGGGAGAGVLVLLRAARHVLSVRAGLPRRLAGRHSRLLLTWLPTPNRRTTSRSTRTRFTSRKSSPTGASAPSGA